MLPLWEALVVLAAPARQVPCRALQSVLVAMLAPEVMPEVRQQARRLPLLGRPARLQTRMVEQAEMRVHRDPARPTVPEEAAAQAVQQPEVLRRPTPRHRRVASLRVQVGTVAMAAPGPEQDHRAEMVEL